MTDLNQYIPQTDLVVGYRLANLYDFSGNDKTLTDAGTVTFPSGSLPDGLTGNAAAFGSPNSTKYLYCTSTSQADIDINLSTNGITLAGWIKITALPSASAYPTILHWDSHETLDRYVALWYKNDGGTYKLQADFSGNVTTYSVTLTVDTWYFVVFTAAAGAGAATALYLNGASVATGTKGTSNGAGTTKFQIGKHISQSQYWPGYLYNIAAFKKVFTATEILDWYNVQVGTELTDPYLEIDGTDITSYANLDGVSPTGNELVMDDANTSNRDFSIQTFEGRNGRVYEFEVMSGTRSVLDSVLNHVNNAEEFSEFYPFTADRAAYIAASSARYGSPFRYWDGTTQTNKLYHTLTCSVNAYDGLLYGIRKHVINADNIPLPTDSYSVTNAGTYKSGLDFLSISGYFDATDYTEEVDLVIGGHTIRLIDSMLHGDTFTVDRFGHIEHSFYTDFDVTIANLQKYLNGEGLALEGQAGYHQGGSGPITDVSKITETWKNGGYIRVDTETEWQYWVLADKATDTSGPITAADMQAGIRTLGGAYAAVSAQWVDGRYKIISGTTGADSKVRIRDANLEKADSMIYYLKLGSPDYPFTWSNPDPGDPQGTDVNGRDAAGPAVWGGAATAGYHTSGELPSTNITGAGYHISGPDPATSIVSAGTKFKIQNDSEASATEVTLTPASCTTAETTASHMQTQIRAIGTAYKGVIVRYEDGRYKIYSGNTGSASKVRITAGATLDVTPTLKLGTDWGGENFDGSATVRNKFAIQADSEASPTTVTLSLGQAFTNDPASGSNIVLNMSDTSLFAQGDVVIVSSSAGYEAGTIASIVANTSITIATLALNHTTSSRMVTPYTNGTQTARIMQAYIQAIGGAYSDVTVVYTDGEYVITSETTGASSKIRITSDASNDIAARLKLGTANGGTNTDGLAAGTCAKNSFKMTNGGMITFPMAGPLRVYGAPYIEFKVNSVTGTPQAFWATEETLMDREFVTDEIIPGYNKIYFPELQGLTDVYFGIYTGPNDSIDLYEIEAVVRRDIPRSELPTVEPGNSISMYLSGTGSAKLSNAELYYRDAFWS